MNSSFFYIAENSTIRFKSAIITLISLYIITLLFSLVSLIRTLIIIKDFYFNRRSFIVIEILKTAIVAIITTFLI